MAEEMAKAIFLSPNSLSMAFRLSGAAVCVIKVPAAISTTGRIIGKSELKRDGNSLIFLLAKASSLFIDSGVSRKGISIC